MQTFFTRLYIQVQRQESGYIRIIPDFILNCRLNMEEGENHFQWVTEGLLLFIISVIGLVGNSCSVVTCSRQRVQRIFHRLLLVLATFDTVTFFAFLNFSAF